MADDTGSSLIRFARGRQGAPFAFANPMFQRIPPQPVITPCIGTCTLGHDGLCDGCYRTGDEIAQWSLLSDSERLAIMNEVLPAREAARA
jgi:uncharacterized protein